MLEIEPYKNHSLTMQFKYIIHRLRSHQGPISVAVLGRDCCNNVRPTTD